VNVAAVRAEAHRIRRQAARLGMAVAPDGSISVDPLGLPVSPAAVELIGHQIRGVVRSADEADRRAARTGRTHAGSAARRCDPRHRESGVIVIGGVSAASPLAGPRRPRSCPGGNGCGRAVRYFTRSGEYPR
jgi:hypothetical protein